MGSRQETLKNSIAILSIEKRVNLLNHIQNGVITVEELFDSLLDMGVINESALLEVKGVLEIE